LIRVTASRYAAATIDHFQHPRNVGRMVDADRVGRVDDAATETTISIYVKLARRRVGRATFRTLGCSACIAASSVATELLVGRSQALSASEIDTALGGLPEDKRYCAELVAEATRRTLES
jgi:NifU-like protein involved in Fe-S cluster formation